MAHNSCAFSRAMRSPSRGNACPSADSLSEISSGRTPVCTASLRCANASSSERYADTVRVACSLSVVSSPR
ncbi:Uncharacterised protein [Mycobacteroides abscessus subsp. abscessus]|nr:Uncharacterised protein [Mycobacteroides abscessus subsp. abscessus]